VHYFLPSNAMHAKDRLASDDISERKIK